MSAPQKILIIDDEIQMRRLLRMVLEGRGFAVCEAELGQQGLQEAAFHRPDAVLLDLGLPDMDGLTALKRLREWSDVPVLILSVRNQEAVKVEALENGADDYVTKPFGTSELLARLNAILRRRYSQQSPVYSIGSLEVNVLHHEATLDGEPLKLTPTEFALLKALAQNAGRIVTQNQLIQQVWGPQQSSQTEGLRVHINHLRKKLGDTGPRIVNEPGIGYRLVETD